MIGGEDVEYRRRNNGQRAHLVYFRRVGLADGFLTSGRVGWTGDLVFFGKRTHNAEASATLRHDLAIPSDPVSRQPIDRRWRPCHGVQIQSQASGCFWDSLDNIIEVSGDTILVLSVGPSPGRSWRQAGWSWKERADMDSLILLRRARLSRPSWTAPLVLESINYPAGVRQATSHVVGLVGAGGQCCDCETVDTGARGQAPSRQGAPCPAMEPPSSAGARSVPGPASCPGSSSTPG